MTQLSDPFFVIGNPRSGTTMLRLMLTSHRDVFVPTESGWALYLYSKYGEKKSIDVESFIEDLSKCKKIEYWKIDYDKLKRFLYDKNKNYREISSAVYLFCSNEYEKKIYGDKNNYYLDHIEILSNIYPDAKFIHIIRDGRDVARSYRNLQKLEKGKYFPELPCSIIDCAYAWKNNINTIKKSLLRLPKQKFLEIKFEDLVLCSEETLKKICVFLEIEYDEMMLNFHINNKNKNLEPEDLMKWKKDTLNPVDKSKIGQWKYDFFSEDKILFESIACHELNQYGYETKKNRIKDNLLESIQKCML